MLDNIESGGNLNQPDKAHFLDRVSREMDEDLGVLDLSPREALAACCRILAHEGHESGLAGQVTTLGEKPNTWWTLKFGLGFEEATGERMVLVDEDLKPVPGKSAGGRAPIPPCASMSGSTATGPT